MAPYPTLHYRLESPSRSESLHTPRQRAPRGSRRAAQKRLVELRRVGVSVLLRQPHGFEGFSFGLKRVPPNDLLVVPVKDTPIRPLEGGAASHALAAKTPAHQ